MASVRLSGGHRPSLAARLLVLGFALCPITAGGAAPPGFVARDGAGFVLDGAPFHVVGANQCVRCGARARRDRPCSTEGTALACAPLRPRTHALRPFKRARLGTDMLRAWAGLTRGRRRISGLWALGCDAVPRRLHADAK